MFHALLFDFGFGFLFLVVVGAQCVTMSASITVRPPLSFVVRSYVLGLCRACFICSIPDSDGKYGTARKFGCRLAPDALSFVTAIASD